MNGLAPDLIQVGPNEGGVWPGSRDSGRTEGFLNLVFRPRG